MRSMDSLRLAFSFCRFGKLTDLVFFCWEGMSFLKTWVLLDYFCGCRKDVEVLLFFVIF